MSTEIKLRRLLREIILKSVVLTSSYIFLGFWSRNDLRLHVELPVTMPTTVDVIFCCPGPPWLFSSSSNIVSGSWNEKNCVKIMFLWNARTNQRHTHVGNGVEFWNLADFSCNESKLFKINLQIYSNKIVSKNFPQVKSRKEWGVSKSILRRTLIKIGEFLNSTTFYLLQLTQRKQLLQAKNKGKQYFLENSLGGVKKFLSKLALKVQKTKLVVKYKWIFTYKSVHDTIIP